MIVYVSRTGNIEHVISELQLPSVNMKNIDIINEPFILFTYTDGLGQTPQITEEFLIKNGHNMLGVIVSGNRNFGINNFCGCADKISNTYNVPIIRKIDLRGYDSDYEHIIKEYNKLFGGMQ